MRRVQCLTRALQAHSSTVGSAESQIAAYPINAAARLFSSAATTASFAPVAYNHSNAGFSRQASHALPQQQLTSLLSFSHTRSFSSSGDGEGMSDSVDAATSVSAFDPSAVMDAVLGAEEDGWLGAREDVWFFNRYMQSVLRFAQATTGLPW